MDGAEAGETSGTGWTRRLADGAADAGWTATLAGLAVLSPVVLILGGHLPGLSPAVVAGFGLVVAWPLTLLPVLYALGIRHQIRSVPRRVRIGTVVALPVLTGVLSAMVLADPPPPVIWAYGITIPLSFLAMVPGYAIVFPADRESYGRLIVGILGVVPIIAFLMAPQVSILETVLKPNVPGGSAFGVVASGLAVAGYVAEGVSYPGGDDGTLRTEVRSVRDLIDDAFAGGDIGEDARDRWLAELADLRADHERRSGRRIAARRLARHGRILIVAGALFLVLLVIIWLLRGLDWISLVALGLGISLPSLGVLALAAGRKRSVDQSGRSHTAIEEVSSIREEVLETIRQGGEEG